MNNLNILKLPTNSEICAQKLRITSIVKRYPQLFIRLVRIK